MEKKSSEKELLRKKIYYEKNKKKILYKINQRRLKFIKENGYDPYTAKRRSNPDYYRQKEKKRAAVRRLRKKDEINEYQRKRYQASGNAECKAQCQRRHKREPYRIIRNAIRDLQKGVLGFNECLERIDKAIAYSDQEVVKRTGLTVQSS
jgi:hypothetical protein